MVPSMNKTLTDRCSAIRSELLLLLLLLLFCHNDRLPHKHGRKGGKRIHAGAPRCRELRDGGLSTLHGSSGAFPDIIADSRSPSSAVHQWGEDHQDGVTTGKRSLCRLQMHPEGPNASVHHRRSIDIYDLIVIYQVDAVTDDSVGT